MILFPMLHTSFTTREIEKIVIVCSRLWGNDLVAKGSCGELCSVTEAGPSIVTLDLRVLLFQIATIGLSAQPTGCINPV